MTKPLKVKLLQNLFGNWFLASAERPELAWSGSTFVPHEDGFPTADVQVSNLKTRAEAETYAKSFGFEVIPEK